MTSSEEKTAIKANTTTALVKTVEAELLPANSAAAISIPALLTGDDQAATEHFISLYHEAQNGLRRVVAFGLYAWFIKICCLKRSQFLPWADAISQQHGLSRRSIQRHMELTKSVLKACGVGQVKPLLLGWQTQMRQAWHISHCGEILLLPDAEVPKEVRPLREKICTIIDGKSAQQLFFQFKQTEEDEDGNERPKRGNLTGKGNPKAQREAAKLRLSKAEVKALELKAKHTTRWILENCDAQRLGRIDNDVFDKLHEAVKGLNTWMADVRKSRPGQKEV
jgi:hypothetical protein